MTTGELDAGGPAEGDPAPPTTPKAKIPPVPTAIVVAIGVAVLLIVGLVATSGHGGGKPVAATLPPVASTTAPHKALRLDSAVVSAADLGGAWSALQATEPLPADKYTEGVCGSTLWAHDTDGYAAAYQEGAGQYAHRVVISTALEAPSVDVANQQRQFVASPGFVPCLKQLVGSEVLSVFGPSLQPQIGQLSVDPLNFSFNTPTTGYVVTVGVDLLAVRARVLFTEDVIVVFSGRYQGTLDIAWCSCTPGGQELVNPQTSQLIDRLQALPPDLTKGTSA